MRPNKTLLVIAAAVAAIAVTAFLVHHFAFTQPAPAFRFATVERGDLQALVSATGTLNAVTALSPVIIGRSQVIAPAGNWRTVVNGVDTDYQTIRDWQTDAGAFFGPADVILVPYTTAATRLTGRPCIPQILAIVMGILGGAAGLVPGITGAMVLAHFTGWETVISPFVMVVAVGFSGAVGVFFGYCPAQKAAALNPIEALRYE